VVTGQAQSDHVIAEIVDLPYRDACKIVERITDAAPEWQQPIRSLTPTSKCFARCYL
jgi:hypothetical protein